MTKVNLEVGGCIQNRQPVEMSDQVFLYDIIRGISGKNENLSKPTIPSHDASTNAGEGVFG